jgi:hypothetical protein
MEPQTVWLKFSDDSLANAISESKPPDGITVSKPKTVIEASAASGIWFEILISVAVGIPTNLLASFIYECLKDRCGGTKKRCRINHEDIILEERNILILIEKQRAAEKSRNAQWAEDHKKPTIGK